MICAVRHHIAFAVLAGILSWNRSVAAFENEGETRRGPSVIAPEARRLFDEGTRQYERGEYGAAARSFEDSYAISHAPGLLFNMGQAYRLGGDCVRAIARYKEYLRVAPSSTNRGKVEARVQQLQQMAECQGAEKPAGAAGGPAASPTRPGETEAAPAPAPSAAPSPAIISIDRVPVSASKRDRRPGLEVALVGGSAALGVTGAWLLARGIASTNQTSHLFRNGGVWDPAAADRQRTGERLTWIGSGLLAGATLVAAGAAWSIARGTDSPEPEGDSRLRRRRLWGLTLSGSAVLMGATATFLLVRSHSTNAWISETFQRGGSWDAESARWQENARTERWVGSFLAGGAALAAAGATWMLFSTTTEPSTAPSITVGAFGRGAGVQWRTTF